MSARNRRLDRLYAALTPKERAVLVLRWWKQHRDPDRAIWSTMPAEDRGEFRRTIDLIRAANELAPYIRLLRECVSGLGREYTLLSTRRDLGKDIRALSSYLRASTGEPVTKSDYRRRTQELRAELVPAGDLAEIAVERYVRCSDADDVDDPEQVSDEAFARALSETERELVRLFETGTLAGEETDGGVRISAGTFFDWVGEPIPVMSPSGSDYEVLPDNEAEAVAAQQRMRQMAEQLIARAPGGDDLPLDVDAELPDAVYAETAYAVLERLDVIGLRDGVRGRRCDLHGFEIVLADLAATEFNGEDPLRDETRAILAEVRRQLLALRQQVQVYVGTVELGEPDVGKVALLRKSITRRAKRLQTEDNGCCPASAVDALRALPRTPFASRRTSGRHDEDIVAAWRYFKL